MPLKELDNEKKAEILPIIIAKINPIIAIKTVNFNPEIKAPNCQPVFVSVINNFGISCNCQLYPKF